MASVKLQHKSYQFEDRAMEGYAMAYHAYLARRDLPGPEPTFADFVEIRKMQERIEKLALENFPFANQEGDGNIPSSTTI